MAAIPKSVHEDRIKENIDVFDFSLTENEMNSLKSLDKASPMIGDPENPEKTLLFERKSDIVIYVYLRGGGSLIMFFRVLYNLG